MAENLRLPLDPFMIHAHNDLHAIEAEAWKGTFDVSDRALAESMDGFAAGDPNVTPLAAMLAQGANLLRNTRDLRAWIDRSTKVHSSEGTRLVRRVLDERREPLELSEAIALLRRSAHGKVHAFVDVLPGFFMGEEERDGMEFIVTADDIANGAWDVFLRTHVTNGPRPEYAVGNRRELMGFYLETGALFVRDIEEFRLSVLRLLERAPNAPDTVMNPYAGSMG